MLVLHPEKHGVLTSLLLTSLSLLFQYFDLAADVLAENSHLTFKFLTPVCKVLYSILYILY